MAWGVALWSFATFLTPWAADRSVWALLAMRVLLGVAEGVALPSMNNMVSRYRLLLLFLILTSHRAKKSHHFSCVLACLHARMILAEFLAQSLSVLSLSPPRFSLQIRWRGLIRASLACRWFPQTERSGAVGLAMAGFSLGSAIGLLLSPVIMSKAGVFGPFVIFGLFGFLWVLVWVSGTTAAPDSHPQISRYELQYILGGSQKPPAPRHGAEARASGLFPPIGRLLSRMPTWALILANAMHSWVRNHRHNPPTKKYPHK